MHISENNMKRGLFLEQQWSVKRNIKGCGWGCRAKDWVVRCVAQEARLCNLTPTEVFDDMPLIIHPRRQQPKLRWLAHRVQLHVSQLSART
eukprot:m.257155 g.257155  ORF g.257155 m.257155 type:complete len:91 (-) comp17580_c0_seq13:1307-1579(-)